jgi:hypothetical protein
MDMEQALIINQLKPLTVEAGIAEPDYSDDGYDLPFNPETDEDYLASLALETE